MRYKMRNPLLTDHQAALVGAFVPPMLCAAAFAVVAWLAGGPTHGGVGAAFFLAFVAGCCRL